MCEVFAFDLENPHLKDEQAQKIIFVCTREEGSVPCAASD